MPHWDIALVAVALSVLYLGMLVRISRALWRIVDFLERVETRDREEREG